MYPHSTVQPIVPQYRERSPNPYVGMKAQEETDKKPCDTKLTNLAGILIADAYIVESTCASQPMNGVLTTIIWGDWATFTAITWP